MTPNPPKVATLRFGARFVPPPPVVRETVCRWCGRRRVRLVEVEGEPWLCPSGCAANDEAPYYDRCHACGREFQTGKADHVAECWQCGASETAARAAAAWGEAWPDTRRRQQQERLSVSGNVDE